MGVTADKQWQSLLTLRGFPVYSMGVQGYAPQQIAGALERYGKNFQARYVFFGYTPGFEERTRTFDFERGAQPRRYTGGMETINQSLKEIRRREYRIFPVLNALISAAEATAKTIIKHGFGAVGSDPDSPLRYTYEIENALQMRFDAHSRDFKLTLDAIRKSEELSKDLGAQLVILLYAQRPWAFYEVVKGEPRPAWFFEDNLRTHLTLFAKERNIPLIDTHEIFEEVSKTALENKTRLPYFSDGHPNDLGQELIANQVAAFLENQNKQVTTSEKQLSAE